MLNHWLALANKFAWFSAFDGSKLLMPPAWATPLHNYCFNANSSNCPWDRPTLISLDCSCWSQLRVRPRIHTLDPESREAPTRGVLIHQSRSCFVQCWIRPLVAGRNKKSWYPTSLNHDNPLGWSPVCCMPAISRDRLTRESLEIARNTFQPAQYCRLSLTCTTEWNWTQFFIVNLSISQLWAPFE